MGPDAGYRGRAPVRPAWGSTGRQLAHEWASLCSREVRARTAGWVTVAFFEESAVLREIADSPPDQVNTVLQRIYTAPVQDGLIGQRIEEVKRSGAPCAVSTVPGMAERRAPIAEVSVP